MEMYTYQSSTLVLVAQMGTSNQYIPKYFLRFLTF